MTAQVHEKLILDGEQLSMAFCPPLPFRNPRLKERSAREMAAEREQLAASRGDDESLSLDWIASSACWRGYQATWEVKDGCLFLVAVAGCYKLAGNEPLLADWFTGVLRVPRGEMLAYVHMDFESIYEQDLLINVERGRVTGQRIQDNRDRFAWQRSAPARLHVTAREERVLRLRFGIGLQEHSVSELAEALGVTVQRIRRIEAKAFAKLKHRARRNWAEVLGFL